jgi:hypothetical protein
MPPDILNLSPSRRACYTLRAWKHDVEPTLYETQICSFISLVVLLSSLMGNAGSDAAAKPGPATQTSREFTTLPKLWISFSKSERLAR